MECGCPPDDEAYRKAKKTFEKRYEKAVRVDADALAEALEHLAALGAAAVDLGNSPTLLQLLRHDPEAFKGIHFVFSNEDVTDAVKAVMDEEVARDGGAAKDGGAGPLQYDYFSNWDKKETDWPGLFISVYRRSNGSIVLGMRRHLRFIPGVSEGEGETEDVFVAAKVRWNTGRAAFGDLRKLATVEQCATEIKDWFQSRHKFDHVAGKVLDARSAHKVLKLT